MNRNSDQSASKKPYEQPRLAAISLRPEEAVLGACKVLGQSGSHSLCGFTCANAGS